MQLDSEIIGVHSGEQRAVFSSDGQWLWSLAERGAPPAILRDGGEVLPPGTLTISNLATADVTTLTQVAPDASLAIATDEHVYVAVTDASWLRVGTDGAVSVVSPPAGAATLLAATANSRSWLGLDPTRLYFEAEGLVRTLEAEDGWTWTGVGGGSLPSMSARSAVIDPTGSRDMLVGLTQLDEFGHPRRWKLVSVDLASLEVTVQMNESANRIHMAYWSLAGPSALVQRGDDLLLHQSGRAPWPVDIAGIYAAK